jgi:pimeloyl-[acyl-carrier protein] methyl ester esterase
MLHGWGFDATIFDELRAALPDYPVALWDRGYFGPAARPLAEGPTLAIGHSLGALLLAADPPPGCVGLVAINGFDRFTGEGAVPPRVVARMRARFAEAPDAVLADFRTRCGAAAAPAIGDAGRLAEDLALLATAEASTRLPVLALQGEHDPILPETLRRSAFPSAAREHGPGGHLLPLTHAGWCAERIRAWAA